MNPYKFLNRILYGLSLVRPRKRALNWPETITIEITNRCDVDCIYCSRRAMTRKIGDMDLHFFRHIIDQCKGYTNIIRFLGMGEPILHPEFDKMIRYGGENGLATRVFTNAKSLNQTKGEKLIDAGLDELQIGLDGATKKTYESIKKYGNYEQVKQNVEQFLMLKRKKGVEKPFTVVKMIYMPQTEHEIEDYLNQWGSLADSVEIHPFSGLGGLVKSVDELADEKYRDELPVRELPCTSLWSQQVVLWNGDVVPCVMDYNGECIIGNLRESTLKEIWNNLSMREVRRLHIKRNFGEIQICANCLHGARSLITTGKAFKAFCDFLTRSYPPGGPNEKFKKKLLSRTHK